MLEAKVKLPVLSNPLYTRMTFLAILFFAAGQSPDASIVARSALGVELGVHKRTRPERGWVQEARNRGGSGGRTWVRTT